MNAALVLLRDALFGDPAVKAKARVHAAMEAIAKCKGDLATARQMVDFYTDRVMSLDPYKAWWDFADAREKLEEYTNERDALGDQLQTLYQRLNKVEDFAHASVTTFNAAAKRPADAQRAATTDASLAATLAVHSVAARAPDAADVPHAGS